MKKRTLLTGSALLVAAAAAVAIMCSTLRVRPGASRSAANADAPTASVAPPERPEPEGPTLTSTTAAASKQKLADETFPAECSCGSGSVCVQNLPTRQQRVVPTAMCQGTSPGPGNKCQGLQVFDAGCGGCVPGTCAGKCASQVKPTSTMCVARPPGCDPVSCACFNPCGGLKCNDLGSPPFIRCTR